MRRRERTELGKRDFVARLHCRTQCADERVEHALGVALDDVGILCDTINELGFVQLLSPVMMLRINQTRTIRCGQAFPLSRAITHNTRSDTVGPGNPLFARISEHDAR
jgi:hypothetical protein